jgi:diguanylate cyclase (GGDEF)-like protein
MIEILRTNTLCADLTNDELQRVSRNSELLTFSPGDIVFAPDEEGTALYIISEGEVVITRTDGEDAGREIARFVAGDSFGELDLLLKSRRNATARAVESTRILVFPGGGVAFEDVYRECPGPFARVLFRLIGVVASRLRTTNTLISQNDTWVRQLRNQVYTDKLTGFYNKSYLHEELARRFTEQDQPVALVFVKPDNFKMINDTYGHDVGDRTLERFASTIGTYAPAGTTPIRYRGNEIALLAPGYDYDRTRALAVGARDAIASISISDMIDGAAFTISASASFAVFPDDGRDADQFIATANETVYAARSAGGGRVWHIDQRE